MTPKKPTLRPAPNRTRIQRKAGRPGARWGANVEVEFQFPCGAIPKSATAALRKAVKLTIVTVGYLPACTVGVLIADDAALADLNRKFRNRSRPTDVLSFASGETDPGSGRIHLGDVAISLQRASAQAKTANHPLTDELRLLLVHGTLHLFGFDHDTPLKKKRMWEQQVAILNPSAAKSTPIRPQRIG
jgi:probable rRNA maturation factor